MIELDVAKGKLELLVSENILLERRKKWKQPKAPLPRGYWKLYFDHVNQAHDGADLRFTGGEGQFIEIGKVVACADEPALFIRAGKVLRGWRIDEREKARIRAPWILDVVPRGSDRAGPPRPNRDHA